MNLGLDHKSGSDAVLNFGLNYSSVQQSSGSNFGPGPNRDITSEMGDPYVG